MSFQDELKKNMISKEEAKKAELLGVLKERELFLERAGYIVDDIKRYLIECVKNGKYSIQDGKTIVSCTYDINWHYMQISQENNLQELIDDKKKFILFRDPNLIYRTWSRFNIDPKYSKDFTALKNAVIKVAKEDNISIDVMVINKKTKELYEFPCRLEGSMFHSDYGLVFRATSEV